MPEQTDPARELIRRAYADDPYTGGLDLDSGLADVLRRAGRPRLEGDGGAEVVELEPRRGRRRFAAVATFAAAVVTILAVYAASAGVRPHAVGTAPGVTGAPTSETTGTPLPGTPLPGTPLPGTPLPGATPTAIGTPPGSGVPGTSGGAGHDPGPLPSNCADSWVLTPDGGTFAVTAKPGGGCPQMPIDRLWLLDAKSGNGGIHPGDAVMWPVTEVNGATGTVQPPFTFHPGGWPGLRKGHLYWIMFLTPEAAAHATAGADAYTAWADGSYGMSEWLIG